MQEKERSEREEVREGERGRSEGVRERSAREKE